MSSLDSVNMTARTGPTTNADGSLAMLRSNKQGSMMVQNEHGLYYEQASRGNIFMARAVVTAPVIFTTAAGTGGPLIWNPPSSGKNAVILAAGFAVTTVTTVAAALGLTGGPGQPAAPTSTTAADSLANLYIGGGLPACSAYRVGTPTAAGTFLLPFADLHTGALTVDNVGVRWVNIDGLVVVPPGCWASISSSATASTTVAQLGLVWEEVPV